MLVVVVVTRSLTNFVAVSICCDRTSSCELQQLPRDVEVFLGQRTR